MEDGADGIVPCYATALGSLEGVEVVRAEEVGRVGLCGGEVEGLGVVVGCVPYVSWIVGGG